MDIQNGLIKAIVEFDLRSIGSLVEGALNMGLDPMEVLASLREGMNLVGKKFESHEYFISELIMCGRTMKMALEVLKPRLAASKTVSTGTVVLGTIQGDLHDLGKDIVKTLLVSAGFEVYDLGVDVPPEKFVEKAKEVNAEVIGISALLSTTIPTTAKVIEALEKAGMRDRVKVIIGGATVRSSIIGDSPVKKFGVDAAVVDAVEGVNIIKSWTLKGEKRIPL